MPPPLQARIGEKSLMAGRVIGGIPRPDRLALDPFAADWMERNSLSTTASPSRKPRKGSDATQTRPSPSFPPSDAWERGPLLATEGSPRKPRGRGGLLPPRRWQGQEVLAARIIQRFKADSGRNRANLIASMWPELLEVD